MLRGFEPKMACIQAVDGLFVRAESVKTKMATIHRINQEICKPNFPEEEMYIVTELLKVAAQIQSKFKLESDYEKRRQILEECLQGFELLVVQKETKHQLKRVNYY